MSTKPEQAAESKSTDAVAEQLRIFEELDFDVYSRQKWNRLSESHADNIVVTYPDGHQTKGLDAHVEELKPIFVLPRTPRLRLTL